MRVEAWSRAFGTEHGGLRTFTRMSRGTAPLLQWAPLLLGDGQALQAPELQTPALPPPLTADPQSSLAPAHSRCPPEHQHTALGGRPLAPAPPRSPSSLTLVFGGSSAG